MIIKIMITKIAARIGANIAATLTNAAVPVSIDDTSGLASPPVVAVEATRLVADAPRIALAVPPPAIIASDQVSRGSIFDTVESITTVPASAARGKAIPSSKWSTQGIK
jgi:hypothetical protein